MKPFDIAKRYKVNEILIYTIMRYLKTKEGMSFTKRGHRYALTQEEVEAIEKELQRRGYFPYD